MHVKGILEKGVLLFTSIRLVLIPVIVLFITKLVGLNDVLVGVATILTAMPAATTTALLASKNGSNTEFASKLVFVTTLLSIISSPLLMLFL